jgi:HD-GYP domain-containing protein (c-di-GMP phosphodiesterase class II)
MLDSFTLERDLLDCRGGVLARRGRALSAREVAEAASGVDPGPRLPLAEALPADHLREAMAEVPCRHLFRSEAVQEAVLRVLGAAEIPAAGQEEIRDLRDRDWSRYRHGVGTAAVATRMLLAAVGEARALPDLGVAALLHDIGMGQVAAQTARSGNPLGRAEVREVAAHPLLGAFHLASFLGRHPAVDAALGHHWRRGTGYPRLLSPPPRSVEVIAVASAFVALTQPRHFRSAPYEARGAADVLIAESQAGEADGEAVQLLVHVLRGALGNVHHVQFARQRMGQEPADNRHTLVARAIA